MGPSLWQKFWRWIVVMEIVALLISVWRGVANMEAYQKMGTKELFARSGALDLQFAAAFWRSATQMLVMALLFSIVMWFIVETHAWWNRRRDRAEANPLWHPRRSRRYE